MLQQGYCCSLQVHYVSKVAVQDAQLPESKPHKTAVRADLGLDRPKLVASLAPRLSQEFPTRSFNPSRAAGGPSLLYIYNPLAR